MREKEGKCLPVAGNVTVLPVHELEGHRASLRREGALETVDVSGQVGGLDARLPRQHHLDMVVYIDVSMQGILTYPVAKIWAC